MIFLLLAVASSAAMTIALKIFRSEGGNRYAILLGNYAACILIGFLMLPDKTVILHCKGTTLACGIIGGILFVTALVLMQRSIGINGAVLTAAFSRLGLIVPLLISLIVFGERPTGLQSAGILIVVAALWVINGRKERREETNAVLLLLVLLAGGLGDGMAKVFDQVGDRAQDTLYILCVFAVAGLLTVLLLFNEYKRTGSPGRVRDYLAGIAVGVPNYFSSMLLLKALASIPAFIAYTVFATGAVLLVTIVSVVFLKERLNRHQAAGLAMIVCALVMLNV